MILLNILVLVFEILYYSMFMYYAKGKGKFKRYLLLFSLITIIGLFIGNDSLYSYLFLIIMMMIGLKYIIKIKVKFYDILIIFVMLLISCIIPTPIYVIMINFTKNIFAITLVYSLIKILLVYLFRNKIKKYTKKFNILWNNNNFYIRYIFTTFMFLYVISSCLYCILK